MVIVHLRNPSANPESPHSSPDATHGEHRGPQKPMSHQFQSHPSKPHQIHTPLDPADPSHSLSSAWSSSDNRRLGSYLLEAGLINNAQIEVVLNDQQMMREMRFGEVLVARGWIKLETIDFVMKHVVEPDRAYQADQEQPVVDKPIVDKTQPTARPEVSPPPFPTSPPQSRVMARARSLDGGFELDIVDERSMDGRSMDERSQNLPPTTPSIRSTDSGQSRNDRKSLPSISDGDGVNWAG